MNSNEIHKKDEAEDQTSLIDTQKPNLPEQQYFNELTLAS